MSEEVVRLTIQYKGKSAVERKELSGREFCFGRNPDSALVIRDGYASRMHFKIYLEDNDLLLIDPGSTNGTLLNGQALVANTPAKIKVGDLVGIGNSDFVLEIFNIIMPEIPKIPAMLGVPAAAAFPSVSRETVLTEMPIGNPSLEVSAVQAVPAAPATDASEQKNIVEAQAKALQIVSEAETKALQQLAEAQAKALQVFAEAETKAKLVIVQAEEAAKRSAQEAEALLAAANLQVRQLIAESTSQAEQASKAVYEKAEQASKAVYEKAEQNAKETQAQAEQSARELQAKAEQSARELQAQAEVKKLEVLAQADLETKKIIQEAEALAKKTIEDAKSDIAKSIEDANNEISKSHLQAEAQVSELIQTAKTQALSLLDQAKLEENQIRENLQDQRKDLVREVQEISEKQTQLQEQLKTLEAKSLQWVKENEKLQTENAVLLEKHKNWNIQLAKQEADFSKIKNQISEQQAAKEQFEKDFAVKKLQLNSELATQERTNQQIFAAIKKKIEQAESEEKLAQKRLAETLTAIRAQEQAAKAEHAQNITKLQDEFQKIREQEQVKLDEFLSHESKIAQKKHREMLEDLVQASKKISARLWFDLEKMLMVKLTAEQVRGFAEPAKELVQQHLSLKSVHELSGQEAAQSSLAKARGNVARHWKAFAFGAGSAAASIALYVLLFTSVNWSANPVQQDMANKLQQHQEDLAKRKFNPAKGLEIKDSLVDSVIYTEGFVEAYQDQKFVMSLTKSTNIFMLKTFLVSEEKSIAAIGTLAATIQSLEEKKQSIHPDFVNKDLAKMSEFEKQQLEKIKEQLGTEVRVDALLKHQKEFFQEYQKRAPASGN